MKEENGNAGGDPGELCKTSRIQAAEVAVGTLNDKPVLRHRGALQVGGGFGGAVSGVVCGRT